MAHSLSIYRLTVLCAALLSNIPVEAQTGKTPQVFLAGTPLEAHDLPISRFRDDLQQLPFMAQRTALATLQSVTFTELDLPYLHVDPNGGIYYIDYLFAALPPSPASSQATTNTVQKTTANEAFTLHSKPGSSNIVYLNFKGHTITGTAWNAAPDFGNVAEWQALPYDTDNDTATFSANELADIVEIWRRVAEDYAPFNIDVTTETPSSFTRTTGHVLITRGTDRNNILLPAGDSAGGIAYMPAWGGNSYSYYSPAFVYSNMLSYRPDFIAEAASHELGHNLALSHDGTASQEYYNGLGSGFISWGPIMGTGYNRHVSQWSKGEYAGANNPQDDLQVINSYLGLRSDDHSNALLNATPLMPDSQGNVVSTTPVADPDNLLPFNKGIIHDRADVDFFKFTTGGGTVTLTATPARESRFTRGGNLDIQLTLYDANANQVAINDPTTDTQATVTTTLPFGTYYVAVDGVGNSTTPYTDYASIGQYFLSGFIPPFVDDDDDDDDGMPDTWETQYGFNPLNPSDASDDADNDGLTNLQEYTAGTNPKLSDTDGDGIDDKAEIDQGRNPTINEAKIIITILTLLLE